MGWGFSHPPHWLLTYKAGCRLKVHPKWWCMWRNKNLRWIISRKFRRTSTQILVSVPFPLDLIVFSRDWGPQFHNLRFQLTQGSHVYKLYASWNVVHELNDVSRGSPASVQKENNEIRHFSAVASFLCIDVDKSFILKSLWVEYHYSLGKSALCTWWFSLQQEQLHRGNNRKLNTG